MIRAACGRWRERQDAARIGLRQALDVGEPPVDGAAADGDVVDRLGGLAELAPGQDVEVEVTRANGERFTFTAKCRIDTANEMEYYLNGGILQYVLRKLAG